MGAVVPPSVVLARIARNEGLDVAAMYIDSETVFLRSSDGLRTVCQVDSTYWLSVWSALVVEDLISRCSS